jgi:hypothetical protein
LLTAISLALGVPAAAVALPTVVEAAPAYASFTACFTTSIDQGYGTYYVPYSYNWVNLQALVSGQVYTFVDQYKTDSRGCVSGYLPAGVTWRVQENYQARSGAWGQLLAYAGASAWVTVYPNTGWVNFGNVYVQRI